MHLIRVGKVLVLVFLVMALSADRSEVAAEFQVNTYTTAAQRVPDVSVGAGGEFVVVWESQYQDGSSRGVFGRRYDSSGSPLDASDFQINTHTPADQLAPDVAVGPAGGFVVVWASSGQDSGTTGVFARRYDSSGNALDPNDFQVNTWTTSNQDYPSVSVGPAGDFVVAWTSRDQDGDYYGIFARRFASSGTPLDANDFQVNTFTTGSQDYAAVDVSPSGDFVVAWQSYGQDGDRSGIFVRRFASSGAPLDGSEFQVNTYTSYEQQYPSVGIGPNGDFVVAWSSRFQDGDDYGVFARRFGSSGSALDGTEFQVNTYTSMRQNLPKVGVDPVSGNFVVSWNSDLQDGQAYGVFARRYDSSGTPLDAGDFQVNTYTTNNQRIPSVAAGPNGTFVVTWMSQGQDGSQYGVFAEQFCADADGDGTCDQDDIVMVQPLSSDMVDCRTPGVRSTRPLIKWQGHQYDRFRVIMSWDPAFPKTARVTSGKKLISRSQWKPAAKKWRRICNNETGNVHIRVFGVDLDVGKNHPRRKAVSDEVSPGVIN